MPTPIRARAQDAAGNVTTTAVTNFSVAAAGASQAVITVENVDGVPFADRLVMNRIQTPQTGTTCKDGAGATGSAPRASSRRTSSTTPRR